MISEDVQTEFKQKFGYDSSRVFFHQGELI